MTARGQTPLLRDFSEELASIIGTTSPERIIQIQWDEFTSEQAHRVSRRIVELGMSSTQHEIVTIFNSGGGSIDGALEIYSAFRLCPAPTTGIVIGRAMSAACIALQGCKVRLAEKHAVLNFHNPFSVRTNFIRPSTKIEVEIERIKSDYPAIIARLQKKQMVMFEVLMANTHRPIGEIEEFANRENAVMTAVEAQKFGLIDRVV